MELEFSLEDNSEEVLKAKQEAVKLFLETAGLHLSSEAFKELENTPKRVDTSLLRNSITYAISGEGARKSTYSADQPKEGRKSSGSYSGTAPEEASGHDALYVGTNVEYGIYVHEGTRKMEANRFLSNAFNKNKDQLEQKLKEALEK